MAMAPITNTLTEHGDALFQIVENALQFSLTVAEAGVVMDTPVLVNTIKGLEAVLEMRAASLLKTVFRRHSVRVKMKLAAVGSGAKLTQELEKAGMDYKDQLSRPRKAEEMAGKLGELLQDIAKSEAVSGH